MGRLVSLGEDVDGKTPLESLDGLLVDIKTRGELNALEFVNISKPTTKYLIRRPSEKKAPFTSAWFVEVHREMYEDVWKWAGEIRVSNKNIGIDKSQIREALKNLEKDYNYWLESGMPPDELTARLHHRLVFIHPFENGNGRWARLITNIFLKQRGQSLIKWPDKELLRKTGIRERYLKALREADRGIFKPLTDLQNELRGNEPLNPEAG